VISIFMKIRIELDRGVYSLKPQLPKDQISRFADFRAIPIHGVIDACDRAIRKVFFKYDSAAKRSSSFPFFNTEIKISVAGEPGGIPTPCVPANSISQGVSEGALRRTRHARIFDLIARLDHFACRVAHHPLFIFNLHLLQYFACPRFIHARQIHMPRRGGLAHRKVSCHLLTWHGPHLNHWQAPRRGAAKILIGIEQDMRDNFKRIIRPMATSARQAARRADKLGDWRIPSRRSTDFISRMAPQPSATSLTTSNDNVPIIWRNNDETAGSSLAMNAASACPRNADGNPSVCSR